MNCGRADYNDQIICVGSASALQDLIVEALKIIEERAPEHAARLSKKIQEHMYGRIPMEEPVFLMRSSDSLAAAHVQRWAITLGSHTGGDTATVSSGLQQAERMLNYRGPRKLPDVPRTN